MVITRIAPLSCGKIAAVLYGGVGLIVGVIVSVVSLAGGFRGDSLFGPLAGGLIGVGAIVLLPIFYGGLGLIGAIIASWLYNAAASVAGGIEVDVK